MKTELGFSFSHIQSQFLSEYKKEGKITSGSPLLKIYSIDAIQDYDAKGVLYWVAPNKNELAEDVGLADKDKKVFLKLLNDEMKKLVQSEKGNSPQTATKQVLSQKPTTLDVKEKISEGYRKALEDAKYAIDFLKTLPIKKAENPKYTLDSNQQAAIFRKHRKNQDFIKGVEASENLQKLIFEAAKNDPEAALKIFKGAELMKAAKIDPKKQGEIILAHVDNLTADEKEHTFLDRLTATHLFQNVKINFVEIAKTSDDIKFKMLTTPKLSEKLKKEFSELLSEEFNAGKLDKYIGEMKNSKNLSFLNEVYSKAEKKEPWAMFLKSVFLLNDSDKVTSEAGMKLLRQIPESFVPAQRFKTNLDLFIDKSVSFEGLVEECQDIIKNWVGERGNLSSNKELAEKFKELEELKLGMLTEKQDKYYNQILEINYIKSDINKMRRDYSELSENRIVKLALASNPVRAQHETPSAILRRGYNE